MLAQRSHLRLIGTKNESLKDRVQVPFNKIHAVSLSSSVDVAADGEERTIEHCLRGTKIYNEWAYNDVIGLRFPISSKHSYRLIHSLTTFLTESAFEEVEPTLRQASYSSLLIQVTPKYSSQFSKSELR